jgi:SAM-dependent methyltransferase
MPTLSDWFATPRGEYVLGWEQAQYDNAVEDVFGFNAVQVGLPGVDLLRESRIPLRFSVDAMPGAPLIADPAQLPLATHSVDLLVLPHVLEFSANPHQILREVERVLMPEGQVIISGFNPLSFWGIKGLWGGSTYPWCGSFIGLFRLRDWLTLLGFELNGGRFGCYAPPFDQARWLQRFSFMESAGDRWWPIAGGVYVVRAIKHTAGMRLVAPPWREQRAQRPSLVQVARRDNVIHVRPVARR